MIEINTNHFCRKCSVVLSSDNCPPRRIEMRNYICRSCSSAYNQAWVKTHHEQVKLSARLCARKRAESNSDRIKQTREEQYLKHKQRRYEELKRRREEHPEIYRAHLKANTALKKGILERQPCEVCGEVKSHMHHDDYSKPLAVRWMCTTHHMRLHKWIK